MDAGTQASKGKARILRRFLVLIVLMFWQGGFVFYAAVVVPVAMSILHPPSSQSFVTQVVSRWLNLAGAAALAVLALDIWLTLDPSKRRRTARWTLWGLSAAGLGLLFVLHPRLSALMKSSEQIILDRGALNPIHRLYLCISTGQWLCVTIFLNLMLRSWQEEDREK